MNFGQRAQLSSVGTYGGGFPLMVPAFQGLEYKLEIKSPGRRFSSKTPRGERIIDGLRCTQRVLNQTPVDLFLVEADTTAKIKTTPQEDHWEKVIKNTKVSNRPKLVMEAWPGHVISWEYGPAGKSSRVRWEEMGYDTRIH